MNVGSDAQWEGLVAYLFRLGITEAINDSEVSGDPSGHMVLPGAFAIETTRPTPHDAERLCRLIMDLIPINAFFKAVVGDTATLTHAALWQRISLQQNEILLWSSNGLRGAFYIGLLPPIWRQYMTFSKRVSATIVGNTGAPTLICVRVCPMGLGNAVACFQPFHRQVALQLPHGVQVCQPAASVVEMSAPLLLRLCRFVTPHPTNPSQFNGGSRSLSMT